MRKTAIIICVVALVVGVAMAENLDKKASKGHVVNALSQSQAATLNRAVLGTEWIQYDDNTAETDGSTAAPSAAVVGNVFVPQPAWTGNFYCDQFAIYHANVNTNFYMSAYAGINGPGTALTGASYITVTGAVSGAGVWNTITSVSGWLGNTTFNWNSATENAYIGGYITSIDNPGLDTSAGNGFSVTSSGGAGYTAEAWNAMVRARFNGAGVPVELVGFTVE